MKPHTSFQLTKILPTFRNLYPRQLLHEMQAELRPSSRYVRKVCPIEMVDAMIRAIVLQLSSQAEIVHRNKKLGVRSRSALSYNLSLSWMARFVGEMLRYLLRERPSYDPRICKHPRTLLDTMPVLLQRTQRGHCERFNNVAKGCGVMGAFNLDAQPGQCPVAILGIFHGTWNDTYRVRNAELISNGPIYIADRGFYSLETLQLWRGRNVHFIVRAKRKYMSFDIEKTLKVTRNRKRKARVESDQIVTLKTKTTNITVRVRLLKAYIGKDEDLWLVTDQFDATVDQLLDSYRLRGGIEVYHRFVKNSLGLAHLYSYNQTGIETQIYLITVVANVLFLSATEGMLNDQDVQKVLRQMLKYIRAQLGLPMRWRRNTVAQRRNKPLHNRRHLKSRNAELQIGPNL